MSGNAIVYLEVDPTTVRVKASIAEPGKPNREVELTIDRGEWSKMSARPGPAGTKHVATAEGFIWEPGPRKGGA